MQIWQIKVATMRRPNGDSFHIFYIFLLSANQFQTSLGCDANLADIRKSMGARSFHPIPSFQLKNYEKSRDLMERRFAAIVLDSKNHWEEMRIWQI